ncbi:phosphoribosylamine--glycine ligase [Lottiidibacillus patelloidae]|uniref:Phosphoribosylamine--glycine ligase n=1 Tax=Lottiidibacillus patelloidae TaxID=2670334 RepID=A0A263BRA4_9BACI|nr:phosphoribosylamine--glycine ligase [Lottiidibacillus patelloidae]OZM56230.1 phosphoribosylamine--glycine ligase [Lottiidibacillus patelloidae]
MKVLIIGRGGREHALAWKVAQNKIVTDVFVAPGNDGMADIATCVPIFEHQQKHLIAFVKKERIDLTIVGSELPLLEGIVDCFQENGLTIFGPTKAAAEIEGSKAFAKRVMQKYNIPTAKCEIFTELEKAKSYVSQQGTPLVIKADGLAAGKGVVVAKTMEEAYAALDEMMRDEKFGKSSSKVVIEEFLEGEEFSFIAFVNGAHVYPLALSQDHKRAFDFDEGPNTGGMGAYSPVPQISRTVYEDVLENTIRKVAKALKEEGRSFTGVLYAGMIATEEGPKVIEFNARFGDPEAQVLLPRMKSDIITTIGSVLKGEPCNIEWSEDVCVGVVLASKGYPNHYDKNASIKGLEQVRKDTLIFHAGTKLTNQGFVTNGGRVLLVGSLAKTISEARSNVYKELVNLQSDDVFYRHDIASKALKVNI